MATHHDLARKQAGVLHRRQLADLGIGHRVVRRAVQTGDLVAVRPHVFVAGGSPPTWSQRAWVALLDAAPGAAISHRTAAHLHRIGRIVVDTVDVLEEERSWHRPGVAAVHRTLWLPAHHIVHIEGLPVTTLARTVFDLCGLVSPARRRRGLPYLTEAQATRALDDGLARTLSIAQANRILAELGRRGRPGTALMRRLMDVRGEGFVATESELEDLLLAVLRGTGLPLPSKQHVLGGSDAPVGRVDFVFLEHRVVVEADGRRNHTALLDAEGDRWRDLELGAAGFVVVRVSWHQLVHQPDRFVASLRRLLDARAPGGAAAAS